MKYTITKLKGHSERVVAEGGVDESETCPFEQAFAYCEGFIAGRYHPSEAQDDYYYDDVERHLYFTVILR